MANASIVVLSVFVIYWAAEAGFLRYFTVFFPLKEAAAKFDNLQGVYPLLQSSKKGFYPEKNYIAITGDSYAAGLGDGAYSGDPHTLRNHSAHFIQDLSGRDVVSYGQPGSGSVRGMITNPVSKETYIRKTINKNYPPPSWLLIYFYEGNDLTENWLYYQKTFVPFHPHLDYFNQENFDTYIKKTALGKDHLYLSAMKTRFQDRLFFYRYINRLYIQHIEHKKYFTRKFKNELKLKYEPDYKWTNRFVENPVNKAIINENVYPLADNMQGPSMDLTTNQLEHGVKTFSMALHYANKNFPHSHLAIIYIPSVLTTYKTVGDKVHVQNFFADDHQVFLRTELDARAQLIQQKIREETEAQGILFIDTTEDLQKAAMHELLHGPKDLNHLNVKGYHVLAESIVRQINPYWQ